MRDRDQVEPQVERPRSAVRVPAPPAPDVQRVLALQRGAGNRAVAGMLARVPIESLGVDTEKDGKAKVLEALMRNWSKFTGLAVDLTAAEAKALLDLLRKDIPADLVGDLNEIVNPDSSEDEGPSKSKQESSGDDSFEWDKEEESEDFFAPSLDFFKAPKTNKPADKRDLGLRFASVMSALKYPVFLSGGGAVTLLGSPREIKDLDFRIELACSWSDDAGFDLIEKINDAMSKEFDTRVRFSVSDIETGFTIKTEFLGVEVSITRTPLVAYLTHGATPKFGDPGKIPQLGGFDLIFDKCYSLMMRTERPKMHSDLFDLLHTLNTTPGSFAVLPFLMKQREDAYGQQRARRKLDDSMFQQLLVTVRGLLADDRQELQLFFKQTGDVALLDLADRLVLELERIIKSPPAQLTVI